MKTICSIAVLAASALIAQFSAAEGQITDISPNPNPVPVCGLETLTVNGTGACAFGLNWGDGSPHVLVLISPNSNLPFNLTHRYLKEGSYSINVDGGACGTAATSLQVLGGAPTITGVFNLGFPIQPGNGVIILGQNFGNLPGQLSMHLTNAGNNPTSDYQLLNPQFIDTAAAGTIPPGISGVPDQVATFTVVAQCGATSNAFPANFTATRDFAAVPFDQLHCSTSGQTASDACLNQGGRNWPQECGGGPFLPAPGPDAFGGYHAAGWTPSGNKGTDFFWVTRLLNNDWVLDSVTPLSWVNAGDTAKESVDSNTVIRGTPSPFVGVDWYVGGCGMVNYVGQMIITGPVGTPY